MHKVAPSIICTSVLYTHDYSHATLCMYSNILVTGGVNVKFMIYPYRNQATLDHPEMTKLQFL